MVGGLWLWDVVLFQEVIDPDNGPGDSSPADFLLSFIGDDANPVETALDGFDFGSSAHYRIDSDGNAMFDIDGRTHRHFAGFAEGLQGVNACRFHETNHVRGGIDGRELMIVRGEGVLVLHPLLCRSLGTDRNLFRHRAETVPESGQNGKQKYCAG